MGAGAAPTLSMAGHRLAVVGGRVCTACANTRRGARRHLQARACPERLTRGHPRGTVSMEHSHVRILESPFQYHGHMTPAFLPCRP